MNMPIGRNPSSMGDKKTRTLIDMGILKKEVGNSSSINISIQTKNINGKDVLVGTVNHYGDYNNYYIPNHKAPIPKEYTDMVELSNIVKDMVVAVSTEMTK